MITKQTVQMHARKIRKDLANLERELSQLRRESVISQHDHYAELADHADAAWTSVQAITDGLRR